MNRLCPKCGHQTDELRCPHDAQATVLLTRQPESKILAGTEINGRYRIERELGRGGFGAVYAATHLATAQQLAIKILALAIEDDDADMIMRFFQEAQVTASLRHPNTVRVFDFGQTEGGALYIAMELLQGETLHDLIKRRLKEGTVLSEEETIDLAVQALRSLGEAHEAGLVHRDLKPQNIYLHEVPGDDPVVKVLDFGIAKRLGHKLTGTGKALGTPTYMSPEQAANRPLDQRSDLYALGVVLFQCVAGVPPFDSDTPLTVLLMHVNDRPPDLRRHARAPVTEGFVRIIERALEKDPEARFESARAMRLELERLRRGEVRTVVGTNASPDAKRGATSPYVNAPAQSTTTPGKARPIARPTGRTGAAPSASVIADAPTMAADVDEAALEKTSFLTTPHTLTPGGMTTPPSGPQITISREPSEIIVIEKPASRRTAIIAGMVGAVIALVAVASFFVINNKEAPAETDAGHTTQAAPHGGPDQGDRTKEGAPPAPPAPQPKTSVRIESEPAGATVEADGKVLGKAPQDITLVGADAKVIVVLRMDGYESFPTTVLPSHKPAQKFSLKPLPKAAVEPAVAPKKDDGKEEKRTPVVKKKRSSGGDGDKKSGGGSALDERL